MNVQAYHQVIKTLGIPESKIDTDMYTEKILPYDTDKLAMIFLIRKGDDEDEATFDLYVVLYDLLHQRIAQSYKGIDEYFSDAIALQGLTIDTAKFILTEGVRAFGIRAFYKNNSRISPYSEETFSLFLPQGNSLKKVLHQYRLGSYNGEYSDFNCEGSWSDESDSMFIMDNKKTNDYFNIKNRQTFIRKATDRNCDDKIVEKSTKTVFLKYNGEEYEEYKEE
ncbi:hypothetical protein RCZ04_15360 [Capnocytophaga sp. HP1101]